MEIVTLKMDGDMVQRMDSLIKKHQYGTRTEFIRSALRDKMSQIEKDELIRTMLSFKGSAKGKTSNAELRKIRKEAGEEYLRKKTSEVILK